MSDNGRASFDISVRDLAEFVWRRGDYGTGRLGIGATMQQGAEGHRWLQARRSHTYEAEVPLVHETVRKGVRIRIQGRADGLDEGCAPAVVEEIKTTARPLASLREDDYPLHWAQAKLYAAMLTMDRELAPLCVRLTYLHVRDKGTREFDRVFDRETLVSFLDETVETYATWLEEVVTWRAERDEQLHHLSFPFGEFRPGQRELAAGVFRSVRDKARLFLQAPTGSGKTMASLFGALKAIGDTDVEQLAFLTAKTVGRRAAFDALETLATRGKCPLKALEITARESICFRQPSKCGPDDCEYAAGCYDRIPDARTELYGLPIANRQEVERVATQHQVCPYVLSTELLPWADVVVCDFNYAFDPSVSSAGFGRAGRKRTYLVDEAHNLVDRAREMYSAELIREHYLELRRSLDKEQRDLRNALRACSDALKACWDQGEAFSENTRLLPGIPGRLTRALERHLKRTEAALAEGTVPEALHRELITCYFASLAFQGAATQKSATDALYAEKHGKAIGLHLYCVDPSARLRGSLSMTSRSAVFFSATLSPFDYFSRILGGGDDAVGLAIPSPFPPENLRAFVVRGVSTRYRDRAASATRAAEAIVSMTRAAPGNYLAFFPSYEYLQLILSRVAAIDDPIEVFAQTPEMTEDERAGFLENFVEPSATPRLGFAVLGGLFGEGIDLVGERLKGAAIVSPGLPALCTERELIRRVFETSEGRGFDFAYLFPGMNKVVQAAGRVIRSETDQGVVLLIGERFSSPRYRRLLPDHWDVEQVAGADDLQRQLVRFWTGPSRRESHQR